MSLEMVSGRMSKPQRASTFTREGGMAVVKIGAESTVYHIHKVLLVEHSEYFQKALNGPWKTAQEDMVELKDVDRSVFDVFVDWVYTGKLSKYGHDWQDWVEMVDIEYAVGDVMMPLCAFATRIFASGFLSSIEYTIIGIVVRNCWLADYATVISAFTVLPSESPVLRLLVDSHCHGFREKYDDNVVEEKQLRAQLPHDFLVRVMLRYIHILEEGKPPKLNACDYHDHQPEAERKECEK
ncbi:hypothetical protein IQ06DRAFT_309608 [Phaeosphaeriaceae sp. SRC1lsM3a]|nr:hypothetical protein IQ06DRAFT_309608 [Stagonospora sp. SRC1lsM3a]